MKVRLDQLVSDLSKVVRDICHHPEDVKFAFKFKDVRTLDFFITPNKADAPLLNGANGRVINSIKQVALLAGARFETVFTVYLQDGENGEREPDHDPMHNWDGDLDSRKAMAQKWLDIVFGRKVIIHPKRLPDEYEIRAEVSARDDGLECTALSKLQHVNDMLYAWSRRRGLTMRIKPKK